MSNGTPQRLEAPIAQGTFAIIALQRRTSPARIAYCIRLRYSGWNSKLFADVRGLVRARDGRTPGFCAEGDGMTGSDDDQYPVQECGAMQSSN